MNPAAFIASLAKSRRRHFTNEAETRKAGTGPISSRLTLGEAIGNYALIGAWVCVIVFFSILRPSTFFTAANFETVFGSQSVLLILTLGLLLPLSVGEFDLSIGANMGLASVIVAVLNVNHGLNVWLAVMIACAAGLLIGLVNGLLVVVTGVDAFIATLGIGTLVQGIAYALTNYAVISGVTQSLVTAVSYDVFGLPLSFYYGIALAIILWYILRYVPTGRHLRFTGAAPEVARLSGLNVRNLRLGAFVTCGLIASFSGVVLLGTFGSADPNNGTNFLLPAFAGAFLGATAVSPGQFNPWGSVVAVFFLVTGITGLQLLGLNQWIQDVFYGASLVFAVTLARVATRRRAGV